VTGGNGDGTAQGVDAVAEINDELLTGAGNRFLYNRNGLRFSLEFQGGFRGGFAPLTISDIDVNKFNLHTHGPVTRLGLPGLHAAQLGGASGSLDQLVTGGALSGLAGNTSQALRVVDDALSQLTAVEGLVAGFAEHTIATSASLLGGFADTLESALTSANGISEEEELLLLSKSHHLADNVLASLALLDQQRATVVSLLQKIAGL
jgi:hypothetical protein